MKTLPLRTRWLSALLLLGFTAQSGVAATHSSFVVSPGATHEQPADGERGEGHDPASCSFCRIAPALDHALFGAPPCLPMGVEAIREPAHALSALRPDRVWSSAISRAPPSARSL